MKEVHWTLSCSHKEDHQKIKILSERGRCIKMTTILGRPVCWEYELDAQDRDGNPILIKAFVSACSA